MKMSSASKGKEKSSKPADFAKGGRTGLVGNQKGVAPAQGGKVTTNNGGNNTFGVGFGAGKGKMFPQQSADPQEPGVTADTNSSDATSNEFKVTGGKTHMFGRTGSQPAKAR